VCLTVLVTIRILPHCLLPIIGTIGGRVIYLIPFFKKLVIANIKTAFPEFSEDKVKTIAKKSLYNMCLNMLEFAWVDGRVERIERCYGMSKELKDAIEKCKAQNKRIIFITPHLGSWEAAGSITPHFGNIHMCAIAKPVKNPYIDKLLNRGGREKSKGLEIIFRNGAIQASCKALKEGKCLAMLVDQNTRARDGGAFVNFFGLPVASTTAPGVMMKYCSTHNIPYEVLCGAGIRQSDGRVYAHAIPLSKDFHQYKDEVEILQEIMDISEELVREYPEQYLWLYKRFLHIPATLDEETKKRYPFYARVPSNHFYRKIRKVVQE
jgi:KDO2-lipid IV(A) lauroyltransferase